jgi:hypothetical protein
VLCRAMSGFYEVTAASGTAAAGDESASWHDSANTLVSHPAAGRTITAASDAARSPSSTRPTGSLRRRPAHRTPRAQQASRTYTALWAPPAYGRYRFPPDAVPDVVISLVRPDAAEWLAATGDTVGPSDQHGPGPSSVDRRQPESPWPRRRTVVRFVTAPRSMPRGRPPPSPQT